jgi:hypothetical protein
VVHKASSASTEVGWGSRNYTDGSMEQREFFFFCSRGVCFLTGLAAAACWGW